MVEPVLKAWSTIAMGGHSSLPTPGERSNSDFSGHLSLFWSPWLELGGAINKVPVLRLNTNSAYCSKIFQLQSCTRSTSCSLPLKHLPSNFPFPMNSLKCIHLNDSSPGMSSLNSLQWAFLLRLPRSFLGQLSLIEPPALIPLSWGIMTPNVGRFPPATLEVFEDVSTCLFSLHLVSFTNLTINTLFNSSPKLLSPVLFIEN